MEVTRGGDLVSWAQVLKRVPTSHLYKTSHKVGNLYKLVARWVASSRWRWDQTGDTSGWWATSWLIRPSLEI